MAFHFTNVRHDITQQAVIIKFWTSNTAVHRSGSDTHGCQLQTESFQSD
jgi:hypothetical protein